MNSAVNERSEDKSSDGCGKMDLKKFKEELACCRRKIKGYEVLNTLYKESLDKCKSQEEINKKLEEKLMFLEAELAESRNIIKVKEEDEVDEDKETGDKDIVSLTGAFAALRFLDAHERDALLKQPEFLKFLESIVSECPGRKCKISQSSSDNSFVKISDDYDDLEEGSREIMSKSNIEEHFVKPSLEDEWKEPMKKWMDSMLVNAVSMTTGTGDVSNVSKDLHDMMKWACQVRKHSQLIQIILENVEKENKDLKGKLKLMGGDEGQGNKASAVKVGDDAELCQKISDLLSCKEALLMMLSNKDRQLEALKWKVISLNSKFEQSKMSTHVPGKLQNDYEKLEYQLDKAQMERQQDRQEVNSLRSEVKLLKRRLEDWKQLRHPDTSESQSKCNDYGEVEILKQQVAVYAEDFSNERKDREKAQALIESLQKSLDNVNTNHRILSKSYMELRERYQILLEKHQNKGTLPPIYAGVTKAHRIVDPPGVQHPIPSILPPTAPSDDPYRCPVSWECPRCTFINEGWELYCTTCSWEKN